MTVAEATHPHPPAQYQRRLQRVRLPLHPLQKVARPMDHFKAGMGTLAAGHQQALAMTPVTQPAQAATTRWMQPQLVWVLAKMTVPRCPR